MNPETTRSNAYQREPFFSAQLTKGFVLLLILFWFGAAKELNAQLCSTPNFVLASGPHMSGSIGFVIAGDLNGDGRPDLIVTGGLSNSITVLMNNGDGTFRTGSSYAVGVSPTFVRIADLDGDGKMDLAGADPFGNLVWILYGNGDGTFQAPVSYATGPNPDQIDVADLNGDGILDLVVLNVGQTTHDYFSVPGDIAVLLGTGGRHFASAVEYHAGYSPALMTVGDFNGDGVPDLAVVSEDTVMGAGSLMILLGVGDGSFVTSGNSYVGRDARSILVGDFNGDGHQDLALGFSLANSPNYLVILTGNGDGTFQAPIPTGVTSLVSSMFWEDFSGDGKKDLAYVTTGQFDIMIGNGDGTFQAPSGFSLGPNWGALDVVDINGDGLPDFVGAEYGSTDLSFLSNVCSVETSQNALSLPPNGSSSLLTLGTIGTVQAGYALADFTGNSAPYGTAVFTLKQNDVVVSEAGVPASPPTKLARIFVDYRSNISAKSGHVDAGTISTNTGVAIANPGETPAEVTFTLRDREGATVATGTGTIPAHGHRSRFIDHLNDPDIAPNFNWPSTFGAAIEFGSLEVSSTEPVSVLGLRMATNQRYNTLMTTTPIADETQSPSSGTIYLPRIVDGGGWKTTLILMNTSAQTETGTVRLFDANGQPLQVQLVDGSAAAVFPYVVPANGISIFETADLPAATLEGSVQLTPDPQTSAPVASGLFSFAQGGILVTESGIPSIAATSHARIFIDQTNGHLTGLAIANPSSAPMTFTVKAYQEDGVTPAGAGTNSFTLPGNAEMAGFMDRFVSGLPPGFLGIMDISTRTTPFGPTGFFVPLTLRMLYNERNEFLITTFPVADLTRPAPTPIVFPQIADGISVGQYQTQFIMLGTGAAVDATLNFFGDDGSPLAIGMLNR